MLWNSSIKYCLIELLLVLYRASTVCSTAPCLWTCVSVKTGKHIVMQIILHTSLLTLVLSCQRSWWNFNEVTPSGAPSACWIVKSCTFRQITWHISKMISDRQIVSMKAEGWIRSCMCSSEWCHCWWPWVTLNTPDYPQLNILAPAYFWNGQS